MLRLSAPSVSGKYRRAPTITSATCSPVSGHVVHVATIMAGSVVSGQADCMPVELRVCDSSSPASPSTPVAKPIMPFDNVQDRSLDKLSRSHSPDELCNILRPKTSSKGQKMLAERACLSHTYGVLVHVAPGLLDGSAVAQAQSPYRAARAGFSLHVHPLKRRCWKGNPCP